jgi:membrane protease YdiL (CAAX protease family)
MKVAKIKGKLQPTDSDNSEIGWILLFVVFMIICAVFYFTYPFPGGEATIGGFIIIWLRELIFLGVVIVLFIYWLINRTKKTKHNSKRI